MCEVAFAPTALRASIATRYVPWKIGGIAAGSSKAASKRPGPRRCSGIAKPVTLAVTVLTSELVRTFQTIVSPARAIVGVAETE